MERSRKPWEIWNEILTKITTSGAESFTENERIVYLVNKFCCDFENSGYSGFLYNISPADDKRKWVELHATADALEIVGGLPAAQVLRETATLVESGTIKSASTWEDYLRIVDPEGKIGYFNIKLKKQVPELWQYLEDFTIAHFDFTDN
jgi:hypothetical protein